MLENCRDVPLHYEDAHVSIRDVIYETNSDGLFDTIHGKYDVRTLSDAKEQNELIITISKCISGEKNCELLNEFIVQMNCVDFHNPKKTGPWSMFSEAMDRNNKCAEIPVGLNLLLLLTSSLLMSNQKFQGEYDFSGALLKEHYLNDFLASGVGQYRIKMLFHKLGVNRDLPNLRGCIEMDFDLLE